MNDILARRARRATVGIALSAALVAGIAPATAIAAETSSPTGAAVSQTSSTKQANTTTGKLANTGDTAPSAITLAGIAAMGLGITATATRRIKNSK